MQRQVIAGHRRGSVPWTVQAAAGGRLTDGMGSGGHNVSGSGQDSVVVQAAAGQMAQLDLHAQWLSKNNNVRVYIDGEEDGTVLQGTVLPPPEGFKNIVVSFAIVGAAALAVTQAGLLP